MSTTEDPSITTPIVSTNVNPALEVAHERASESNDTNIVILSTGIKARLLPVAPALYQEVFAHIKKPVVPLFHDEESNRDIENPNHPDYLAAVEEYGAKQQAAMMDAMLIFGIELLEPLPDIATWLPKLKQLERRGQIDLSGFDTNNALDLEYLYKKFIVVHGDVIAEINKLSAIDPEQIGKAQATFRRYTK